MFFVDSDVIYYASNLIEYESLPTREDARYGCVRCKRTYGLKKTLGRHLRLDCGQVPTFCCQVCPKKFKHGYILLKHLRNTHNMHIEKMRQRKSRSSMMDELYFGNHSFTRYPNIFEDLEDEELIFWSILQIKWYFKTLYFILKSSRYQRISPMNWKTV